MITELIPLEEIVQKARAGDKDCLDLLLIRAYDYFQGYLVRKVRNGHDCEDLLQEALISILYHLHQLQDDDKFWHWAFKIVQNKMFDHFKQLKKEDRLQSTLVENLLSHTKQGSASPVDYLMQRETLQQIHTHLDSLPKRNRDIFRMRHMENLPYSQISKRSNISGELTRLRFHRAKKQLRQMIRKHNINDDAYLSAS